MYKKTKALLSSILASILIESMVFTSVAAPIVDYDSNIGIETSVESLDDYENNTDDANISKDDTEEKDSDNSEDNEENIDSEDSKDESDNNSKDANDEDIGSIDNGEDNSDDTIEENNGENKDDDEDIEDSIDETDEEEKDNEDNINETDEDNEGIENEDTENSEDNKENADDVETKEDTDDNKESLDEEKDLDDIELENDLIQEGVPFRITPREVVDKNNLASALQEVNLYTYNNEEVNSDDELINEDYYYIELSFEEDNNNQFNGIDTYQLPDGFKAYGKDVSGKFDCEDYGTGEIFEGSYTINSKGLITFKFPKVYDGGYFPEYYENTVLNARIKAKVAISEGSIEFDNGQVWEVYKNDLKFDIDKVNPYTKELDDNQIELMYNIKPWVIDGETEELVVRDNFEDIDKDVIDSIEYLEDSFDISYYKNSFTVDEIETKLVNGEDYTIDFSNNGFSIDFMSKEFEKNDSLLIEYKAVATMSEEYYDTTIINESSIEAEGIIKKASTKTKLFKKDEEKPDNSAIIKKIMSINDVVKDDKIRKEIRYSIDIDTSKMLSTSGESFNAISGYSINDNLEFDENTIGWDSARFEVDKDSFILEVNGKKYYVNDTILNKTSDSSFQLNLGNVSGLDPLIGDNNIHIEYTVNGVLERYYNSDSTLTNFDFELNNTCEFNGYGFSNSGFEALSTSGDVSVIVDSYKTYEAEPFGVEVNGELEGSRIKWTLETNESPLKGMTLTSKISENQEFIRELGVDLEITNNDNHIYFNKELTQDKFHIEPEDISYKNNEIVFNVPILFSEKPKEEGCDKDFDSHIVATYYTRVISNTNDKGESLATNDVVAKKCDAGCVANDKGTVILPSIKVNLNKYADAITTAYQGEHIGYTIKLQANEVGSIAEKGFSLIDELPYGLTLVEDSVYVSNSDITFRLDGNKLVFENITLENTSDDIVIKYDTIVNDKVDSYNVTLTNTVKLYDKKDTEITKAMAEVIVSKDIESSVIAGGSGYVTTDFDARVEVEGRYNIKGEDFKFNIRPDSDNPKNDPIKGGTILNDSEGLIDLFKNELKYVGPGEYKYYIEQVVDSDSIIEGMDYDTSVYEVVVKVDYIDKKLEANIKITKDEEEFGEIVFKNVFDGSVRCIINGRKLLENGNISENEFKFKVTDENSERIITNNGSELKIFDETFKDEESIKLSISEIIEDTEKFEYDTTVYEIDINVRIEGDKLVVDKTIKTQDGNIVDEIVFKNKVKETEEKPEEPSEPSEPEEKPEEPSEPSKPEEKPEEPSEPSKPEEKPEEPSEPSKPEEKPDTRPSGNSGSSNSNSESSDDRPITTIEDNPAPLASKPANRVSEIVSNSSQSADKSLHQVIDEMMIPLSSLPQNENISEESLDSLPKTNDMNNIMLYELLGLISLFGLGIVTKRKFR